MKLLDVKRSDRKDKRFVASFDDGKKIHFGQKGGKTFIDEQDEKKKSNYIARHKVNEDWKSVNPGSLSRYVLWSQPTLAGGIKEFKKNLGV